MSVMNWARLLKRVFDLDLEHCPICGGELKLFAAVPHTAESSASSTISGCPRSTPTLVGASPDARMPHAA